MDKKSRIRLCLPAMMFIVLMGWGATKYASGKGYCHIPNPNEKLCAEAPPDAVASCDALTSDESGYRAKGRRFTCEIHTMPDGTVESDAGHTTQVQAPCWQKNFCIYNEASMRCEASGRSDVGWHPASCEVIQDLEPCQ